MTEVVLSVALSRDLRGVFARHGESNIDVDSFIAAITDLFGSYAYAYLYASLTLFLLILMGLIIANRLISSMLNKYWPTPRNTWPLGEELLILLCALPVWIVNLGCIFTLGIIPGSASAPRITWSSSQDYTEYIELHAGVLIFICGLLSVFSIFALSVIWFHHLKEQATPKDRRHLGNIVLKRFALVFLNFSFLIPWAISIIVDCMVKLADLLFREMVNPILLWEITKCNRNLAQSGVSRGIPTDWHGPWVTVTNIFVPYAEFFQDSVNQQLRSYFALGTALSFLGIVILPYAFAAWLPHPRARALARAARVVLVPYLALLILTITPLGPKKILHLTLIYIMLFVFGETLGYFDKIEKYLEENPPRLMLNLGFLMTFLCTLIFGLLVGLLFLAGASLLRIAFRKSYFHSERRALALARLIFHAGSLAVPAAYAYFLQTAFS